MVIFFDGVCNLCNRSVQFVIKRDRAKKFRFASLQGKTAALVLKELNIAPADSDSFILLDEKKVYTRSTAALRVLRELGGLWKLLYVFIIVPPFIRDGIYNFIARNRYKWFGKREECMIPTPELKERFLE